jgi:signal transduction histidine kinase
MEHWQLFTGGVAHDFNNLLTSILGQSTLALRQLPEDAKARGHIERVIQAAEYAASLSDQLLTYSKGNRGNLETINLNQLIQDHLNLIDGAFLDGISLQTKFTPGLPAIQVKKSQLQQVVMNLLINAAEAIQPEDGMITIRTGINKFDKTHSQSQNGRPPLHGNYVYLQVQDTGIGMNPATQALIFQPFFTTKPNGRGLGLSAIYEIIKEHQGNIAVNSQEGQGTTFTIYLPGASFHAPLQ